MNSAFMDLGSTVDTLYHIAKGEDYFRILHGHIQPFLLIFSIPYLFLSPTNSTYLILILQNALILSPILIILINRNYKYSILYLLNPYIYYISFNTFNIDCLIVPLLSIFLITSNRKYFTVPIISAILICMVKEPYALVSVACGFYLLKLSNQSYLRIFYSLLLILFSISYFYLSVEVILPKFAPNLNLLSEFNSYGSNINEILLNFNDSLGTFIFNLFDFLKFKFIFLIILIFTPFILIYPFELFLITPILTILLGSNNSNYYSIGHHYLIALLPIYIYCLQDFIYEKKEKFLKYIIIYTLLLNIIISPSPISRLFFTSKITFYNYNSYFITDREEIIKAKIKELFSNEHNMINLSIQNNIFDANLFAYNTTLLFPDGIFTSKEYPFINGNLSNQSILADYVLIDTKKQPFIYDKSCDFIYEKCQNILFLDSYNKIYEYLNYNFFIQYQYGGFIIYKRFK